ncbi:HAD family hydrolase [Desulfocurvus sp. DL9XJH121]
MPCQPYRAVVFDFDGTLAELTIDFQHMKRELLAEARRADSTVPPPGNMPALEWMDREERRLARRDPDAARDFALRLGAVVRRVETEAAARGRLFPFARPLLASLAEAGVRTAIITRNCSEAVGAVFPDAARAAGVVLSRDDVGRVKPDPEHLMRALDVLGVAPEQALMVGDHVMDIETGRRAGADAAGVLTGSSSRDEFLAAGACRVADDAQALLRDVFGAPAV